MYSCVFSLLYKSCLYCNSFKFYSILFQQCYLFATLLPFLSPDQLKPANHSSSSKFSIKKLIQPPHNRIIYVYSDSRPNLNDSVEYANGIKNLLPILPSIDPSERNLIVLDDQMSEGEIRKRQPAYSPKGPIIKI